MRGRGTSNPFRSTAPPPPYCSFQDSSNRPAYGSHGEIGHYQKRNGNEADEVTSSSLGEYGLNTKSDEDFSQLPVGRGNLAEPGPHHTVKESRVEVADGAGDLG